MAKKNRILFIVTQAEWGGAQRYIFDLASQLMPENYEITVAAGKFDGRGKNLFTKLDEKKIKSYTLKNLVREINPWQDVRAYFEIKKLIKTIRPDIVHLNSSKAGVIGALAAKRAKIKKVVYTVHGFVFNEPMPMWKKFVYLVAEKFSARFKDTLICVSDYDRKSAIKNQIAPLNKLVTVHNGLDTIELLPRLEARRQLHLPDNKKVVGTIANFYLTKDLKTLIQAANIVTKLHPETIFVVIGDGQQRNQLTTEIKNLKLEDVFLLAGEKEQASQYLAAFDVYVCSSVKEGLPYSIIEAMKAGLPIASTNVGGIPELLTDEKNALVVKSGDPDALAKAIDNILEDENLSKKISAQAKADMSEKFSLSEMTAKTKAVYEN
ncbi:MAG: glycosyltransferase family 4 protein [Candidatus Buchananbacteria bacterium]|nr:glycosyltransferase family 4 protein [Candidatus Buchananbacteria bacterium]